jgi:hypothetical protein
MLNLHHPNILLCMGAHTKPPNLIIVTELMPRGRCVLCFSASACNFTATFYLCCYIYL